MYRGYVMFCIAAGDKLSTLKLDNGEIITIPSNELRLATFEDFDVVARMHAAEMLDVKTLVQIITRKLGELDKE